MANDCCHRVLIITVRWIFRSERLLSLFLLFTNRSYQKSRDRKKKKNQTQIPIYIQICQQKSTDTPSPTVRCTWRMEKMLLLRLVWYVHSTKSIIKLNFLNKLFNDSLMSDRDSSFAIKLLWMCYRRWRPNLVELNETEKKFKRKEDARRKRWRKKTKKHDGNRWKQIKDHRQCLNTFLFLWQWWWWWLGILGSLSVYHFSYGIHDKISNRIILVLCFLHRQSLSLEFRISLSCLWPLNWCEFWIIIYFLMFVVIINSLSFSAHLSHSSLHGISGCGYYSKSQFVMQNDWRNLAKIVSKSAWNIGTIDYYQHHRHITEHLMSETPHMSAQNRPLLTPNISSQRSKLGTKNFGNFFIINFNISFDIDNNFQLCMQIIMFGYHGEWESCSNSKRMSFNYD